MSTTENAQKGGAGGTTLTSVLVGLLLLIYLLCPPFVTYSVTMIYGKAGPPPNVVTAIDAILAPTATLMRGCPPYRVLIDKEWELLGIRPRRSV